MEEEGRDRGWRLREERKRRGREEGGRGDREGRREGGRGRGMEEDREGGSSLSFVDVINCSLYPIGVWLWPIPVRAFFPAQSHPTGAGTPGPLRTGNLGGNPRREGGQAKSFWYARRQEVER